MIINEKVFPGTYFNFVIINSRTKYFTTQRIMESRLAWENMCTIISFDASVIAHSLIAIYTLFVLISAPKQPAYHAFPEIPRKRKFYVNARNLRQI